MNLNKNALVALMAAMLVPAFAPTAAAADASCNATIPMPGNDAAGYAVASPLLASEKVEYLIGSPDDDLTFDADRIVSSESVEVSIWAKPTAGGTCTQVLTLSGTAQDFNPESGKTYFLFVDNTVESPQAFEARLIPQ